MKINWDHTRCIACMNECVPTVEHLIPKSIGGILTSNFLCKNCNECFGATFEAKVRLAPEIRKAASTLGQQHQKLKDRLEHGAIYKSEIGEHVGRFRYRKNDPMGTTKLQDGSLVVPESEAIEKIKSVMRSFDAHDCVIGAGIRKWKQAPAGQEVDLGEGAIVRKWENHPSTPMLSERPLNPIVPLKTAYEFTALLVGSAIYQPEFQFIRDILIKADSESAEEIVTAKLAQDDSAFHGIAFFGGHDIAQFQIRLFGVLAYTIHFPNILIHCPSISYTHDLDRSKEHISYANESGSH